MPRRHPQHRNWTTHPTGIQLKPWWTGARVSVHASFRACILFSLSIELIKAGKYPADIVGSCREHLSRNWGRKGLTSAQDGSRAKTGGGDWGGTDLEEQESREEITGVSETLRSQSHLGIKAKGGGGRETGQPAL